MRIAYFVKKFPKVSQTFIINQMQGILDLGHDVTIFAAKPIPQEPASSPCFMRELLEKTHYESHAYQCMPANKMLRVVKAVGLLSRRMGREFLPAIKSLNVFQYGGRAASLALFYSVLPYLEHEPFDIIHCQFGTLAPKALMLRQLGAISGKLVTSLRGFDLTQFIVEKRGFYKQVFSEGDLFLPVSGALKAHLLAQGCQESKIIVHHSGVAIDKFAFRVKTIMPGEPVNILSVARLVPKKGLDYAIKAVAKTIDAGCRLTYTIVGDGLLREPLEILIRDLNVQNHIQILGAMPHAAVIRCFNDAHLFLAPSVTAQDGDEEGIPNVLKEAMASGLPVISTLHGGIPELVQDSVSGYLVPERDVEALVSRLIFLCKHHELWAAMGRHGRKQVETYFDSNVLNRQLSSMYERLMERDSSVPAHLQ